MPSPQIPTSLHHAARGALQRLVPRGWWHASAGSGDHVAGRDAVRLPTAGWAVGCGVAAPVLLLTTTTGWLLGGPRTTPRSLQRRIGSWGSGAGRDPGRQAAPSRPSRRAGVVAGSQAAGRRLSAGG